METFPLSHAVTPAFQDELRQIFGLEEHEMNDVSFSNRPKLEAYIELQDARTFAMTEAAQAEGITPMSRSVILDAARVLARTVRDVGIPPAISPIPGGGIGFQWNGVPGAIFAASLFGDGLVTFSAIFSDSERFTGTSDVSPIRECLIASLRDVVEGR